MALTVAQRRVEFGIRLALGARPSDIVPLVLRRTLAQLVVGLGVGAVAAAALGRAISSLLTGVDALDAATLAAAAASMLAAGVAACLLPALAAGRLDPVEALKRAS
jgi:putative ABC transport system permease protein